LSIYKWVIQVSNYKQKYSRDKIDKTLILIIILPTINDGCLSGDVFNLAGKERWLELKFVGELSCILVGIHNLLVIYMLVS